MPEFPFQSGPLGRPAPILSVQIGGPGYVSRDLVKRPALIDSGSWCTAIPGYAAERILRLDKDCEPIKVVSAGGQIEGLRAACPLEFAVAGFTVKVPDVVILPDLPCCVFGRQGVLEHFVLGMDVWQGTFSLEARPGGGATPLDAPWSVAL